MCTKHSCKSSTECGSCSSCNSHDVSIPLTESDTNDIKDNKIIPNSLPTECTKEKTPTVFLKGSRQVISKKATLKILKQLQKENDRNKLLSK